jgi:hypothetical protein
MIDALLFFPRLSPGDSPFVITCLFAGLQDRTGFVLSVLAVPLLCVPMMGSTTGGLDTCHTGSASTTAWAPYYLVADSDLDLRLNFDGSLSN